MPNLHGNFSTREKSISHFCWGWGQEGIGTVEYRTGHHVISMTNSAETQKYINKDILQNISSHDSWLGRGTGRMFDRNDPKEATNFGASSDFCGERYERGFSASNLLWCWLCTVSAFWKLCTPSGRVKELQAHSRSLEPQKESMFAFTQLVFSTEYLANLKTMTRQERSVMCKMFVSADVNEDTTRSTAFCFFWSDRTYRNTRYRLFPGSSKLCAECFWCCVQPQLPQQPTVNTHAHPIRRTGPGRCRKIYFNDSESNPLPCGVSWRPLHVSDEMRWMDKLRWTWKEGSLDYRSSMFSLPDKRQSSRSDVARWEAGALRFRQLDEAAPTTTREFSRFLHLPWLIAVGTDFAPLTFPNNERTLRCAKINPAPQTREFDLSLTNSVSTPINLFSFTSDSLQQKNHWVNFLRYDDSMKSDVCYVEWWLHTLLGVWLIKYWSFRNSHEKIYGK